MKKSNDSNLEKVNAWKGRLAALGFQNAQLATAFDKSLVTITRWLNPDKYGLQPSAGEVDRVEAWFAWHESRAKKKDQ